MTLIEAARDTFRRLHDSPRTEEAYLHWIRAFIRVHDRRHPRETGGPETITRHVSASTMNHALCAVVFLYRRVLELPMPALDGLGAGPAPRAPPRRSRPPRRPDSEPTHRISPERAPQPRLPHFRTSERAPSRLAAAFRLAATTAPTVARLLPARRTPRPGAFPRLPARRNGRPDRWPPRSVFSEPPS